MNHFEERFAAVAVPSFMDHFGERDADDEFEPVEILLTPERRPFKWSASILGRLTTRYVETAQGEVVPREQVVITGPTASLRTGHMPLSDRAQVRMKKYGDEPFSVFADECEYGGPITKLTLLRQPINTLANYRESRTQ